ncbi:uncharacterized protein LOC141906963 isoform X2 [Tubulanus polymorphus]|uniref:uncharacterized protein LOC141906963 isoform X2 n=1 Tax=Tubulanus polymorphus TaxID=672921 RepID=UPI003DA54F92
MMDTAKGCCWKCDKPQDVKTCSRCKIAKYCTDQCLKADAAKHKIDCQHLGTNKIGPCDFCQVVKPTWLCSRCLNVSYCSRDCQRKHWPSHKQECNKFNADMRHDFRASVQISRAGMIIDALSFISADLPWYWGNQTAVDWLQLANKEGADYECDISVLSVGCGNLGSVLLTTANIPDAFRNKVNFVLADVCPHIMARNVLFHYMIMTEAKTHQECSKESGTKCSKDTFTTDEACRLMSQIMYSLRLSLDARNYLVSALDMLIVQEENSDVLGGKFESLKQIWRKWKDLAFDGRAVGAMKSSRKEMMSKDEVRVGMDVYLASIPKRHVNSCKKWFEDGLFARTRDTDEREMMKFPNSTLTMINPWRDESEENALLIRSLLIRYPRPNYRDEMLYAITDDSVPPVWWKYDAVRQHRDSNDIVDMFDAYFRHVLRRAIENYRRIDVKFVVDDYRYIDRYVPQDRKFDRIATSNLADYNNGLYELVDDMAPRLNAENKHAVLMTSLMNWTGRRPVIRGALLTAEIKAMLCNENYIDTWPTFLNYLRGMLQVHLKCQNVIKLDEIWKCRSGVRLARFDLFENSIVPFQRSQVKYAVNQPHKHERNLEFVVAS